MSLISLDRSVIGIAGKTHVLTRVGDEDLGHGRSAKANPNIRALRFPSRRARMTAVKALFNLKILFFSLIALVLIGVLGFHFLEGWPWFDGFYMVLPTITTIGYGEIYKLSTAGRVFNTFIIIDRKSVV